MSALLKKTLFRMWAAGAVCFFAAWGRAGPAENTADTALGAFSLNLIGTLVVVMVIADIVIVNPVIRMASGKPVFGEERKGALFIFSLPLHFLKVTAIMALLIGTYYFLNVFFIRVFALDPMSVPLPLEPLLFGILYGLYYFCFEICYNFIRQKLEIDKEKK